MKKILLNLIFIQALTAYDIFEAVDRGDTKQVRAFIDNGENIHGQDGYGWTLLHIAAANGDKIIASILINRGIHINATDNHGYTPLHRSIANGHIDIAMLFIDNPLCDHTIEDENNETAEDIARMKGYIELADILSNRPINLNDRINESGIKGAYVRTIDRIGVREDQLDSIPRDLREHITNIIYADETYSDSDGAFGFEDSVSQDSVSQDSMSQDSDS